MKTIKEQADELVKKFAPHADTWDCRWDAPNHDKNDIKCAILSVEHTIEILNMCNAHLLVYFTLEQQTELLTELKSRL